MVQSKHESRISPYPVNEFSLLTRHYANYPLPEAVTKFQSADLDVSIMHKISS